MQNKVLVVCLALQPQICKIPLIQLFLVLSTTTVTLVWMKNFKEVLFKQQLEEDYKLRVTDMQDFLDAICSY